MHVVVCMKWVPEANDVVIAEDGKSLSIKEGVNRIINLFDEYAIEEGIRWVEQHGGTVTVLSLGGEDAQDGLKKALAMGATQAYLLNDPAFEGGDVVATARALAAAIRKLDAEEKVDAVLLGKLATDTETALLGPALARLLGFTQLTFVSKVRELDPAAGKVVVERQLEKETVVVEGKLPALLTVVKDINEPRYPSLLKIRKVARKPIPVLTAGDLGLDGGAVGQAGSKATVDHLEPPPPRPKGEILEGDLEEVIKTLVDKLIEAKIL